MLLMGMQNAIPALGKVLVVLQNVKYRVTMWPSNSTPRYMPRRTEIICSRENLHINVCVSFLHSSPKVEITQMPINC